MITFILNNKLVNTDKPTGVSLLDFIRYDQDLPGTKIGCREGDCGACTVLEGTLEKGIISYKSIVSCLTPLGNVHGKHIVTIEGINQDNLSPVQNAFVKNAATQCGFCTPGFIMSLTGHSLSYSTSTKQKAIAAVSGNICRCTGYKSIERAAEEISFLLNEKDTNDPVGWMVQRSYLPGYFLTIPERLAIITEKPYSTENDIIIAGGTDLMVQRADEFADSSPIHYRNKRELSGIQIQDGRCVIGANTTASDIEQSSVIREIFPEIGDYIRLISSEPIRNMGTIAGNIVNASPIGDLSIMLLALNADVILYGVKGNHSIPLKDFFLGYKKLALIKGESIKSISFPINKNRFLFNFEKVSKRTHLDIASVNSAIRLVMNGNAIEECSLSSGGVSPIPLFLKNTSSFLKGKSINADIIIKANEILQDEISPISDIRGSIEYKKLLLRQLFFAHFIKLFPDKIFIDDLINR